MTTIRTHIQNDVDRSAIQRRTLSIGTKVTVTDRSSSDAPRQGVIDCAEVMTRWGRGQHVCTCVETTVFYEVAIEEGPYKRRAVYRYAEADVEEASPF